jgi:hypothetical protein
MEVKDNLFGLNLVDLVRNSSKVADKLVGAVQSSSDAILKNNFRKHSAAGFAAAGTSHLFSDYFVLAYNLASFTTGLFDSIDSFSQNQKYAVELPVVAASALFGYVLDLLNKKPDKPDLDI